MNEVSLMVQWQVPRDQWTVQPAPDRISSVEPAEYKQIRLRIANIFGFPERELRAPRALVLWVASVNSYDVPPDPFGGSGIEELRTKMLGAARNQMHDQEDELERRYRGNWTVRVLYLDEQMVFEDQLWAVMIGGNGAKF